MIKIISNVVTSMTITTAVPVMMMINYAIEKKLKERKAVMTL